MRFYSPIFLLLLLVLGLYVYYKYFLKLAKEAGARFSMGSNIHGLDVGRLDYCVEATKKLGLTRKDIFTPAPAGKKPIQVRTFS